MDDNTSDTGPLLSTLTVTLEAQRPNNYISSLLYTRATVFYPALRLTESMKRKLIEVAESGGTDIDNPLGSSMIKAYGKNLRVDLHGDYLLQPHRDILDCLLAFADTIKLTDEAYASGSRMTWSDIFKTIENGKQSDTKQDGFDSVLSRSSVVLSTSMYDLAKNMGLTPHPTNYKVIERRIMQLATAVIVVSELDDNGNVVDRKNVRILQDVRFYHDKSKAVNRKGVSENNHTNHLFVVPDPRLLEAIRDFGYFYRLEQSKMAHYKTPTMRSFIKYILTNNSSFLNGKTLQWLVNNYIESIPVSISNPYRMKATIIKDVMKNAIQIEADFNIQFRTDPTNDTVRVYVVGPAAGEA